mgnify:CR=1 FL=1
MLCFYLGGIDLIDLSKMRYDKHIHNGRVQFYRSKGGTNAYIDNKIFPEAFKIMDMYDCKPYVIPLFKTMNYGGFLGNISRLFDRIKTDLKLTMKPYSKSPRYTFINRGQELLIDERITKNLVGHSDRNTHSIYKNPFPLHIRDKAHERIIDFENYPRN